MYQKSTQAEPDEYCNVMNEDLSFCFLGPRKETLAFIRQFAAVYHVENELPLKMAEMVLN
jgi:hypothetical protein